MVLKPVESPISSEEPPGSPPHGSSLDPSVVEMLSVLGIALLQAAEPTSDVKTTLERIATAYNVENVTVVVLPTLVMVQVSGATHTLQIEDAEATVVRLDQAAAISTLAARAVAGELDPRRAVPELARIRQTPPRFGAVVTVAGYAVLSVGFGMTLRPTAAAVPAYAVLGVVVAIFILATRRMSTLASSAPVAAAFIVTVLSSLFLSLGLDDDPFRLIAPPLITFLPGLTLTVAAVELTSNQVIAGASRVVYGIAQLLLLAFGVFAGLELFPPSTVGGVSGPADVLPWWSSLVGVALVAAGFVIFQSAPSGSFVWILVSLVVAWGAQAAGATLLGPDLSGFAGALVVVPFTRFAARLRTAPPAGVLMLVSFWFLVPGALGFVGVNELVTGTGSSLDTVLATGLALFSVAIGFLVGSGLTRDIAQLRRRT